ncbi:MAG TPA: glycerate kinase [Tepidisphaeraceae bacterium]|jgi:glycerate kinase|nr:glycerate kinase [Tepidisphaeraceae bacterium]
MPKTIIVAPDKFKGCLTAAEVSQAIAEGLRRASPDVRLDLCPMADGGEGTVAALVAATNGTLYTRRVTGPLPDMKVDATFGMLGDNETAVVEMAAASGLALLARAEDRNPMNTTTFGTGQLLMAAAQLGAKRCILGIGGSATVDGGIGAAQACGLPVILEDGQPVSPTEPLCGRDVSSVVLIKHGRGSPVERMAITVACDVVNPLFGPAGAADVYGPQKGASPEQALELDAALKQLAMRSGKEPEARVPGAGAAGGLGFAMLAYFNATLASGIDTVIQATRLRQRLASADLCITGEGRLDAQSLHGKAPVGVARLCRDLGVPCIALAGSLGSDLQGARAEGLTAWFSICDRPMDMADALREAPILLERLAENTLAAWISASEK